MKKIKLALLILGISVFAGCSGDAVEVVGVEEDATVAKLTVIVIDPTTGKPVDGAEVSLSATDTVVAKDGIASFENVRIGNHIVKVEKKGYASTTFPATINLNGGMKISEITSSEFAFEYALASEENSIGILLYPKSANLYGYIYYVNTKGQTLPAKDVKVTIEFQSHIDGKLVETTTDASGKYSFTSMPAGISGSIRAFAPAGGLDGIKFESLSIGNGELSVGDNYLGRSTFNQGGF